LFAVTLGGCATIPPQPTWYPVQYPVFPQPAPPSYAARFADDPMMQVQPPPADNGSHSWSGDLGIAGAGAVAGTQLVKRGWLGGMAAGETGLLAGEAAGAAEAVEGAEALEGLMAVILEDWWLLL